MPKEIQGEPQRERTSLKEPCLRRPRDAHCRAAMGRELRAEGGPGGIGVFTEYLSSADYIPGTILGAETQQELDDTTILPSRRAQKKRRTKVVPTCLTRS